MVLAFVTRYDYVFHVKISDNLSHYYGQLGEMRFPYLSVSFLPYRSSLIPVILWHLHSFTSSSASLLPDILLSVFIVLEIFWKRKGLVYYASRP